MNLRAAAESDATELEAAPAPPGKGADTARIGEQEVYVDGGHATAQIYDRAQLGSGDIIAGPAIVTEMDSTTLVLPGHNAEVDARGNLLIRPEEA